MTDLTLTEFKRWSPRFVLTYSFQRKAISAMHFPLSIPLSCTHSLTASPSDRLQKAVCGLADGYTLTVTLTRSVRLPTFGRW